MQLETLEEFWHSDILVRNVLLVWFFRSVWKNWLFIHLRICIILNTGLWVGFFCKLHSAMITLCLNICQFYPSIRELPHLLNHEFQLVDRNGTYYLGLLNRIASGQMGMHSSRFASKLLEGNEWCLPPFSRNKPMAVTDSRTS